MAGLRGTAGLPFLPGDCRRNAADAFFCKQEKQRQTGTDGPGSGSFLQPQIPGSPALFLVTGCIGTAENHAGKTDGRCQKPGVWAGREPVIPENKKQGRIVNQN